MDQVKVNYVAVLVAAVAMFLFGWVWYSIFGSMWMSYTGMTMDMAEQMSGMEIAKSYGGSFVAYLVCFYCLAFVNHAFKVTSITSAVMCGFWTWLGFTATPLFVTFAYQGKSIGLFFIDGGYWLIGMVIGAIILVKMQKKDTVPAT